MNFLFFVFFIWKGGRKKEPGGKQYLTLTDTPWIFLKFQKGKPQATKYLKFLKKSTEKSQKLYLEHFKNLIFSSSLLLVYYESIAKIIEHCIGKGYFWVAFVFVLVYTTEIWSFSSNSLLKTKVIAPEVLLHHKITYQTSVDDQC